MSNRNNYRIELNHMNAIACLFVILVHVLSIGITGLEKSSVQAALIFFPWKAAAFAVPMFIFTGAVKMSLQFCESHIIFGMYGNYLLNRFLKIYIPYVIWVVVYYIVFIFIGYVNGSFSEFVSYLLIGNLSSPFYYVVIIMQFYALMPLWMIIVNKIPFFISVSASLVFTYIMLRLSSTMGLFSVEFLYSDRIFLSYGFFWILGLYAGKYYDNVINRISNMKFQAIVLLLIIACITISYIQYSKAINIADLNSLKIISDLLTIEIILWFALKIKDRFILLGKILSKVYMSSFSVYLSHCLFLTIAAYILQRTGIIDMTVLLLIRMLVGYTLPFAFYFLQHKFTKNMRMLVPF